MSQLPEQIRDLIPAGIRPELAHAIALWLQGYSTRKAAAEAGVAQQTLWDNLQRLPDAVRDGRVTMAAAVQQIAYPVMREAYAQLRERLVDPEEKVTTFELNAIAGTATDKVLNAAKVIAGNSNQAASPLEALIGALGPGGGTVTMNVEPNRVLEARVIEDE